MQNLNIYFEELPSNTMSDLENSFYELNRSPVTCTKRQDSIPSQQSTQNIYNYQQELLQTTNNYYPQVNQVGSLINIKCEAYEPIENDDDEDIFETFLNHQKKQENLQFQQQLWQFPQYDVKQEEIESSEFNNASIEQNSSTKVMKPKSKKIRKQTQNKKTQQKKQQQQQQSQKVQAKTAKKNLWKNIGRQFFQHLQKDKATVKKVLDLQGVKDHSKFFKKFCPKNVNIMNKEQFLKFIFPLQDDSTEKDLENKKILRILVFKFVRENLFQHCTQESRIKNWSCFMSQKHYFLKSIVQFMKDDEYSLYH